jgi:hypothetical protein
VTHSQCNFRSIELSNLFWERALVTFQVEAQITALHEIQNEIQSVGVVKGIPSCGSGRVCVCVCVCVCMCVYVCVVCVCVCARARAGGTYLRLTTNFEFISPSTFLSCTAENSEFLTLSLRLSSFFIANILPVSRLRQPWTSPNPPRPRMRCTSKSAGDTVMLISSCFHWQ